MRQVERNGLYRSSTPWGKAAQEEISNRGYTQKDIVRMLYEDGIFIAENVLSNMFRGLSIKGNMQVVDAVNKLLGIVLVD